MSSLIENQINLRTRFNSPAHRSLLGVSLVGDGELLAALGPTTSENLATTLGGHTSTEAVGLGTLPLVGLPCALHDQNPPGINMLRVQTVA